MELLDHSTIVLLVLGASLLLFLTDAVRYDAVAIIVVLVLAVTGCLTTEQAFAGFASPTVVLVASMYVFAAAVSHTGITDTISRRLIGTGASGEGWLAFRLVLVTGLMSSLLSNAAVVATMIPVLGALASRSGISASRLLMPMAFGSLLGGMLTVIGTSKNIAVNGMISDLHIEGVEPFTLFEFTLFGFCLLAVGAFYFLGPGRSLLPAQRVEETLSERYQVPRFLTEVLVEPGSSLINRTVGDLKVFERYGISLVGLVREGGEEVLAPGPYNRIRTDDVLMLQGEPESIVRMRRDLQLPQREAVALQHTRLASGDVHLVEAVVPPTSPLLGRTLKDADFPGRTNVNVLAVSKHGDVLPSRIDETRIQMGDTLLIQAHARDLRRLTQRRELIVLGSYGERPERGKAWLTLGFLLAVLLLVTLVKVHIAVAALAGALGLVLAKCVRPEDVRRRVDWSVLILIGGMLALGRAFQEHGLATRVAEWMQSAGGFVEHPLAVVALLLVTTLLLTQVINHVAAAVIMTPVALSLATTLGINDRACLMAVLTGAEFAFMSPVAHQANAMVMGPGDYRYRDFLRAGAPLTIVLAVVATLLVPLFWPLAA